jgi:hypothetical protein
MKIIYRMSKLTKSSSSTDLSLSSDDNDYKIMVIYFLEMY